MGRYNDRVRVRSREGVLMKTIKNGEVVYFKLYDEDLLKYGINVEHLQKKKPFTEKLILDLIQYGNKKYGIELDCSIKDIISDNWDKAVVISIPQKSNIYFVQNEWMEEECIIDGIQEIFRTLPDERIEVGDMTDSEKAEYLKLLRSDEGRNIIRDNFI